jgi:hypothetical protein
MTETEAVNRLTDKQSGGIQPLWNSRSNIQNRGTLVEVK